MHIHVNGRNVEITDAIKAYAKENIILGDNLIITYETKTSPLNFTTINNTIKQFFY